MFLSQKLQFLQFHCQKNESDTDRLHNSDIPPAYLLLPENYQAKTRLRFENKGFEPNYAAT